MTVETATYIGQLSPTYPTGSDAKSEGDSHLRLIKSVLQAQFTSLGNAPVTATAAQLNALVSASGLLSVGTSTTSNSIGTGSKTFTTQTGLGFAAGQSARLQDNGNLSNYMLGTISSYNTTTGALGFTSVSAYGSGTIADWSISIYAPNAQTQSISRRAVTSTDTIVAADWGGFIDCTSGTFTLSAVAVATLGNGFWCFVRNSGSGDVTIDPNSTETIDGLTSFVMYPGEARLIQCNGSALYSILLTGFNKTFSSSGTFTKPPGYTQIGAFVQGPGGGGGSGRKSSTGATSGGSGGGAGAWVKDTFAASVVGTTETVTVGTGGAGGAAQTSNDNNGSAGSAGSGASSFGTLLSANAGSGGAAGTTTSVAGGAAGAAAGSIAAQGTAGGAVSGSQVPSAGTAATTVQSATGGGAGGGNDGSTTYDGAAGGASGTSSSASQLAGGALGAKGTTGSAGGAGNTSSMHRGGTGGGGGGYGSTGAGGSGGAGVRGGGGGGGGASTNGGNSGAGGAGGDGVVVVWGIV